MQSTDFKFGVFWLLYCQEWHEAGSQAQTHRGHQSNQVNFQVSLLPKGPGVSICSMITIPQAVSREKPALSLHSTETTAATMPKSVSPFRLHSPNASDLGQQTDF